MPIDAKGTIYARTVTATADTPFQLTDNPDLFLISANIHVYNNDAVYGNAAVRPGTIRANAVVWFDGPQRVADWWFANATAGSNCTVAIIGVIAGSQ